MGKRQLADDQPALPTNNNNNHHNQYNDGLDPKKFKINNEDDNDTLLSDCTTTNNDTSTNTAAYYDTATTTTANTCITLIDNDIHVKSNSFKLLKSKFDNQQLGKKLWLKNRELKHYEFIPIEFSKDLYFVSNFIKRMNKNRKDCPYFRENWYGADYSELLSDKLKMEMDTVPYSEISNSFNVVFFNYNRKQSDFASLNDRISRISSKSETKCIEMICLLAKIVNNVDYFISEYHGKFPFIHTVLKLLSDEEFLLKCISSSSKVLKFVKQQVNKQDLDFILKCVNMNPKVLQYIDSTCPIFNDKQFIIKLFQSMKVKRKAPEIFIKLSTDLKTDREIVLLAAEKGFPVLQYSKEFNNDREIVLHCVRHDGSLLRYASDNLKNDREIVIEAINCNSNTAVFTPLVFASEILKQDRDLILLSIKKYPRTLGNAPSELLSNREFILECVKINGCCLRFAIPVFQSDIEIVIEAIKQNPFVFYFSNIKTIDCKNALLSAVERMPFKYSTDGYVHQMFLSRINDLDIAMKLIEINPFSIHFMNEDIRTKCQELTYKSTLLHNGYWMKHCEDAYQERINHAYYSAKIDSNSNGGGDEINYYRNVNKTNLWKDLEWKEWQRK